MVAADTALLEAIIQVLLFQGKEADRVSCTPFFPSVKWLDALQDKTILAEGGVPVLVRGLLWMSLQERGDVLSFQPQIQAALCSLVFSGFRSR